MYFTGISNKTVLQQSQSPEQVAELVGYDSKELKSIPEASILGVGCGTPTKFAFIKGFAWPKIQQFHPIVHKPYYWAGLSRFDLSDPVADLKEKAKATWALGSYNDIATFLSPMSAHLVRAAGVSRGEHVLDVACGTGITAITACRAGAKVIGIDLTPELLERAKEEAALAGVTEGIEWKHGDAEDLPFPDNSFDIVLSSLGHMFTPRPEDATKELIRVTKKGGRIAFTTWPPEHNVGRFFAAIVKHVPPPPGGPPSPMQWGIPQTVQERLGSNVKDLHFERGAVYFPVLSPNHFWQLFSTKYGPLIRAIQALGGKGTSKVEALEHDFIQAVAPYMHENLIRQDYLLTLALKA